MANVLEQYKYVPVTEIDLSKTLKFLLSNKPHQVVLMPGLLPKGATVSTMITECRAAVDTMLDKLRKYKELGYVKSETQPLALTQLTDSSKIATNYIIANRWKSMPIAADSGYFTKTSFIDFINNWFNYHKQRTGFTTVSFKTVKVQNPNNKQVVNYNLADNYTKPVADIFYPYNFKDDKNPPYIGDVRLSVAQSEAILLGIADRYVNDNDIVQFDTSGQNENDAWKVIVKFSRMGTDVTKTLKGVKFQAIGLYAELNKLLNDTKNRKKLALEDIKTEEEAVLRLEESKDWVDTVRQQGEAEIEKQEAEQKAKYQFVKQNTDPYQFTDKK